MTEPCDQDHPITDQPQVATGNLVGPPPSNPPPPPPGACMRHADDSTEEWASDEDSNNANSPAVRHEFSDDDVSDDDDNASDASEDAISVLAQAAVEEAMEAAVRQAQSPDSNDAGQDSVNVVSHGEQDLSMEANNSPHTRPHSVLRSRPAGSLSQHCHDNKDSDDSEEDEGGWWLGENSPPPSFPRPTSGCSPCSTNQTLLPNHSDDDESETLQEVTPETETYPR